MPDNETTESIEAQRMWMIEETKKAQPDWLTINKYMNSTFASRRKQINVGMMTKDTLESWPALFYVKQVSTDYSCQLIWKWVIY